MKRTEPLESHMYGDPAAILERKQAQEERQRKRGTIHAKPGWSEARKRAEALFDFAGASVQTSSPRGGAMPLDPVRREELSKP